MTPTEHYFSDKPTSHSSPFEIEAEVCGLKLRLQSDHGVFAKRKPDPGTLLLIRTMELPQQGTILDLGCGYGLVGIVAALLRPLARVVLVDVNPRAALLARANCERYRLTNTEVLTGDARQVLGDRRFDMIAFNPPVRAGKAEVHSLIQDAAARLNPGGALWFVGRTKQGIKTLARDVAPWFDTLTEANLHGGYRVIVARKR